MTTKRHPFTTRDNRIKELESIVKTLQSEKRLRVFIEDFKDNIAAYLAHTPLKEWPECAKIALEYSGNCRPSAYKEYCDLNKRYTK